MNIQELIMTTGCFTALAIFRRHAAAREAPDTRPEPQPEPEPEGSPAALDQPPGLYALFETTLGRIVCRLFSEQTPLTVQNFVELARGKKKWYNEAERAWEERPYYNGLNFHRIIPDFMIQGGDYRGNGTGRVGYTFEDEFRPELVFDKPGRLAMANSGPNTNGAQFFITVAPTPWLDHKHSIFGEVVEGQDVANSISKTERDVRDRPLRPVIIRRVMIVNTHSRTEE